MKLFEEKTFWGLQKERREKNIFGKVFKFTMYFLVLIAVFLPSMKLIFTITFKLLETGKWRLLIL